MKFLEVSWQQKPFLINLNWVTRIFDLDGFTAVEVLGSTVHKVDQPYNWICRTFDANCMSMEVRLP